MSFEKLLDDDVYRMTKNMMDLEDIDMLGEPPLLSGNIDSYQDSSIHEEPHQDIFETVLFNTEPAWQNSHEESPSAIFSPQKITLKNVTPQERKQKGSRKEDSEVEKARRIRKASKEKVPGYPTKNLLQNMKQPHLDYISSKLRAQGVDPASFPFLKELISKPTMNLNEYQTLYRTRQFQYILRDFFEEKVLFRALMISRAVLQTKKTSLRMLKVFEKAFREKKFTKIN